MRTKFIKVRSTNTDAPVLINVAHIVTLMPANTNTTSVKLITGENFYVEDDFHELLRKVNDVQTLNVI